MGGCNREISQKVTNDTVIFWKFDFFKNKTTQCQNLLWYTENENIEPPKELLDIGLISQSFLVLASIGHVMFRSKKRSANFAAYNI